MLPRLSALVLALGPVVYGYPFDQCDVSSRVDCGHLGTNQQQCEASGCCWRPAAADLPQDIPWCYHKSGPPGPPTPPSPPSPPTPPSPPSNASCPLSYASKGPPFTESEVAAMRKFFLANLDIQGSGAVVAAPDHNTPGGSYYFHWERDGALSMNALLQTADSPAEVADKMDSYAGWVSKVQKDQDPNGLPSVLAEPKYMIPNGSVFTGGWCRPQNDGPALRALTLMAWADAKTTVNASAAGNDELWGLIQTDLDWVAENWSSNGCDLWEEIRSSDLFWNKFTARAALTRGAAFAAKQSDASRAGKYGTAAKAAEATLGAHYESGFVIEDQSRKKDAAVITAFNDGYLGDGLFGPTSKEVAGTVATLNELFCNSFAINQADTKAGVPGILYGRYEGDNYAGGNPWILLTAALAQLLYRGASELVSTQAMHPEAYAIWAPVLGLPDTFDATSAAQALAGAGDGVLMRLRHHVEPGGFHLTEQIDRNSGVPMAAKDLTWSYACMLKANHARKEYQAARAAASAN